MVLRLARKSVTPDPWPDHLLKRFRDAVDLVPPTISTRSWNLGASETYAGCGKRLRDRLLDSIQDHHPRNRDDQGREAAKRKRFHPQPPSKMHQSTYTTRLPASKLVDRIKPRTLLRALEDGIGGKCIAHQAEGLKRGAIPVDLQDREKKRKHDGNEDQRGRGVSGSGLLRPVKPAQSAQSRQHLQKWPRSPLHAVLLDVTRPAEA
ncbi:hypothetical protein JQ544_31935 [Bradyrhizobium diazoefficiens]|nr:hypothetical protein [Bradyrhizobium diazoefficiens]MBR0816178.1 hypothetical protein [Bradyrhizobium diazoefficiens]